MLTVSSVLSESTTTISSAQATDSRAAAICAASFFAMTVTESFGTVPSVTWGALGQVGQVGSACGHAEAGAGASALERAGGGAPALGKESKGKTWQSG